MKKWLMIISLFACPVLATDLTFQFRSPSFSGIGQSAHYLTIDEQERTRKAAILDEIEARAEEVLRAQENTTMAKFLRNISSRVMSKISQDLSAALFNDETGGTGGVVYLEGAGEISFVNTGTEIILIITDLDNSVTEIRIPVGSFGLCSTGECGI
jgi:hypothetical protein